MGYIDPKIDGIIVAGGDGTLMEVGKTHTCYSTGWLWWLYWDDPVRRYQQRDPLVPMA